jgi:hypothetical protein
MTWPSARPGIAMLCDAGAQAAEQLSGGDTRWPTTLPTCGRAACSLSLLCCSVSISGSLLDPVDLHSQIDHYVVAPLLIAINSVLLIALLWRRLFKR